MWWVENLVSLGDLDVDGCWNGLYFEFELKGCDWFKCGGKFGFEVRQVQVVWYRKRWWCGGNCWIYVWVGKGIDVCCYLVFGFKVQEVVDGVIEEELVVMLVFCLDYMFQEVLEFVINLLGNCSMFVQLE